MAINTSNLYKLLELNLSMNYTIFVVVTLIVKRKLYLFNYYYYSFLHTTTIFLVGSNESFIRIKILFKNSFSFSLQLSEKMPINNFKSNGNNLSAHIVH